MYLGNLWIAPEEVERIAWEEGKLTVDLRWELEEVPVFFDLPREALLRWREDDPHAGIQVQLGRWQFRPENGLRLVLACGAEAIDGELSGF